MKNIIVLSIIISCIFFVGFGCESNTTNIQNNENLKEDIRIYIASDIEEHRIETLKTPVISKLKNHLNKSFPEYNFIYITESQSWDPLENLISGNKENLDSILRSTESNPPDIIIDYAYSIPHYIDRDLIGLDMLEMADLHNINLGKFEAAFIEQLRDPEHGQVYAFPFTRSLYALLYIKDKDENSYAPPQHPTWDDVLTQNVNLEVGRLNLLHQLSVNYRQLSKYEEAKRDIWEKILPIYERSDNVVYPIFRKSYFPPREPLALYNTFFGDIYSHEEEWDMVAYPTFHGEHDYGPDTVIEIITISKHTEKFVESMEVVKSLLSEEFQTELSRNGLGSPLKNKEIQKKFGEDVLFYQGKNVDALFQNKVSSQAIYSTDEVLLELEIYPYIQDINEGKDMEKVLNEMLIHIKKYFEK